MDDQTPQTSTPAPEPTALPEDWPLEGLTPEERLQLAAALLQC